MQGDAALRCFERSKLRIKFMLLKLLKQLGFSCPIEEIMSEAQEKFVTNFYDIYETDNQYLRYIFIVMKHRIIDLRSKEYRWHNTHKTKPVGFNYQQRCKDSIAEDNLLRMWNEMAIDYKENKPEENAIINDFVENIIGKLGRDLHKAIFLSLVEGKPPKKIAEELGYSVGHIGQVRAKHIWPVVKEVMNISDDMFEKLIDCGRIYCK